MTNPLAPLSIANARIVDPEAGRVTEGTLHIVNRHIAAVPGAGATTIDARGAVVAPGIVDLGVFAIDLPAFTAGGITRAALMPDQSPPLDDSALVQRAAAAGKPDVWIHPIAAATRGLLGADLAEMGLMSRAGACAVATGRGWIADSGVMLRLLAYARALDLVVIAHAEDGGLTRGAVATESEMATRLGLSAASAAAEAIAVARDIALVRQTGAKLHFRQITTAAGFDLIRAAKREGLSVTCGITPGHLFLSDVAIGAFRTFARLSPPLREENDRRAALKAVADGTIDVICSGHDPQGPEAKRLPYADAAPGMAGAETLLALSLGLVRDGIIDLPRLFALLSTNPARLLGVPGGRVSAGEEGDIVVFDPDAPWRIDTDRMAAREGNTPFDGLPVQGKVRHTIKGGQPLG